jgi:hypothetical protein
MATLANCFMLSIETGPTVLTGLENHANFSLPGANTHIGCMTVGLHSYMPHLYLHTIHTNDFTNLPKLFRFPKQVLDLAARVHA